HRHRAADDAEVRRHRNPPAVRKRPAVPGAVPGMKVLVSWLRDFVDVSASPDEIAKTMSVRGFAVEGIEYIDGGLSSDSSAEADSAKAEARSAKADAVIDF